MKVFIPMLCLMSLTLAEPPVGDGYPSARSSYDHDHDHNHNEHDHHSEHQRSLSQEYGPPSFESRNSLSNDYETPNARSALNPRGHSFAPPTVRVSFNQRYSSAARSAAQDHTGPAARSFSDEQSVNTRSVSQEYGAPAARSLSQEYGVPFAVAARTLSTEYGTPNSRTSPSEEYGAPVIAARSNQKSHAPASSFRSAQPGRISQDYSAPAARSQFQTDSISQGYTAPAARSNNAQSYTPKPFGQSGFTSRSALSSTYDAPSSRSLSTSYGAPSARNSDSLERDSVSQTYGAPSQKGVSETYAPPNARGLSQEYGVPSSRSNLNNNAIASSYTPASSRSAQSSYPSARDNMPSQQYGVPEQRDASSQGYDLARARALEELQNQEPASYDFGYQIEDQESGSDFGHTETREENRAQGSYFVVLPDGSKQTVEYEADERGYKPRISVEPAAGGYDENAAELASARAAGGPY